MRLWASPAEDQLWAAIKAGQTTTLDFTIKTDTNESVAYFRLTFVPRQVSNPLFERPDRWHQAQLTDFAVAQNSKPALQRQTRQLLVAKIEPLARHFKAREVMSALPDETLRALLSEHGYRERAGPVSALADQYKDLTVGEASRSSAPSAGATTGPSESFKE